MKILHPLSSRVLAFVPCVAGVVALASAGCTASADIAPPAGCASDSTVNCDRATGFSCPRGDNPESSNSSLVCSYGVAASDGSTLYCCVQFQSSSCQPDPSVQGCMGNSYGFSCTGSDSPDSTDPSLACSNATPSGNELLYCCTD